MFYKAKSKGFLHEIYEAKHVDSIEIEKFAVFLMSSASSHFLKTSLFGLKVETFSESKASLYVIRGVALLV